LAPLIGLVQQLQIGIRTQFNSTQTVISGFPIYHK
jgi:hypothetical protein